MLSAVGCACGGHAAAFRASDIASGACAKGRCARQVRAPRPRADASCDNEFIILFIAIVRGAAPPKNLGQEAAPKVGPEMEHRILKIASEECATQRNSRHARVNKRAPIKPSRHTFGQTNRQAHLHVNTRSNQLMSTRARKHTTTQPRTRTLSHQPNTQTRKHTHTHTRTPTHTHTDEHASDQACTQTGTHPPINGMIFHGVRTSPSRRTRRAGRRAVAILHGARSGLTINSTTNGIECMLFAYVCLYEHDRHTVRGVLHSSIPTPKLSPKRHPVFWRRG